MEKEQKDKMLADIAKQEERVEKIFCTACHAIGARLGCFKSSDLEVYRAAQRILECRSALEELAKARFMVEIESDN